jgi:hypothetical protein
MCQLQELRGMKQENAYQWGKVQMKMWLKSILLLTLQDLVILPCFIIWELNAVYVLIGAKGLKLYSNSSGGIEKSYESS